MIKEKFLWKKENGVYVRVKQEDTIIGETYLELNNSLADPNTFGEHN